MTALMLLPLSCARQFFVEDLTGRFQFPGLVVASFSLYMQNFKECEMYIYIYQKSTKKRALL